MDGLNIIIIILSVVCLLVWPLIAKCNEDRWLYLVLVIPILGIFWGQKYGSIKPKNKSEFQKHTSTVILVVLTLFTVISVIIVSHLIYTEKCSNVFTKYKAKAGQPIYSPTYWLTSINEPPYQWETLDPKSELPETFSRFQELRSEYVD